MKLDKRAYRWTCVAMDTLKMLTTQITTRMPMPNYTRPLSIIFTYQTSMCRIINNTMTGLHRNACTTEAVNMPHTKFVGHSGGSVVR